MTIMILMWGETMSDIISRTALLAEYDKHHVGEPGGARKLIEAAPTIDAVPVVRCRFCSPDDCGGMEWYSEDIGVSMTLRRGKLIICNEYGDEAEIPIRHCPICGAKMDGEADV